MFNRENTHHFHGGAHAAQREMRIIVQLICTLVHRYVDTNMQTEFWTINLRVNQPTFLLSKRYIIKKGSHFSELCLL